MRFGNVALIGRTNVGKSTFLNAVLGEPLAIVSPLPQTTRDPLLGVVNLEDAQVAFIDTPGLHRARHELGRRMNAAAREGARAADAVIFMTDTLELPGAGNQHLPSSARRPDSDDSIPAGDREALALVPDTVHTVLVINKVDRLRDKKKLLPLITAFSRLREFSAVVPASMRVTADVDRVLSEVLKLLPDGARGYDSETLTNRPTTFFVREYIREAVLQRTGQEVPHAVAIGLDAFEDVGKVIRIVATIHCEKPGQRRILIGASGAGIKAIGTEARHRIEELVGRQVHLELHVRVTPRWKNMPRQLAELGYETTGEEP